MGRSGRVAAAAVMAAMAGLAATSPASANRNLYASNLSVPGVSAFDISSSGALSAVSGSPFASGVNPEGVAITPDAKHLYVANLGGNTVSGYDVSASGALTAITGSPFGGGGLSQPAGIAVNPAGTRLYVGNNGANVVSGFDIGAGGALTPISGSPFASGGIGSLGVAVAPDGAHVFIPNRDSSNITVFEVSATGALTPIAGSPFPGIGGNRIPTLSADGAHLYVGGNGAASNLLAFDVAAGGTLTPISGSPFSTGGTDPIRTASLTPDGKHLFIANQSTASIAGFDVAASGALTTVAGSPFPAPPPAPVTSSAVTPDGLHLYVEGAGAGVIAGFDISSAGALTAISGSPFGTGVLSDFQGLAVTPNQGPTAAFASTAAPAGSASGFNAGASTDADGTVAHFDWDFGDGTTLPDGGATPSHTYLLPGTYTVTLAVVDNEGCSSLFVFTGQTAYCNGTSAARTQQQVVIADATPPVLKLGGKKTQGLDASVEVRARCSEPCTAVGTGQLIVSTPRGGGKTVERSAQRTFKLKRARKALLPGKGKILKLRVSRRARTTAQRALDAGGSATARIKVKATDPSGNAATKSRRIRFRG